MTVFFLVSGLQSCLSNNDSKDEQDASTVREPIDVVANDFSSRDTFYHLHMMNLIYHRMTPQSSTPEAPIAKTRLPKKSTSSRRALNDAPSVLFLPSVRDL